LGGRLTTGLLANLKLPHFSTNGNPIKYLQMAKESRKTVYRSAKTGEFVTPRFAKKHPATTEKEKVRVKGR
jgi:hypothetical protein